MLLTEFIPCFSATLIYLWWLTVCPQASAGPSGKAVHSYDDNIDSEQLNPPHIEAYRSCNVNCITGDAGLDAACQVSGFSGRARV